MHAVVQLDHVTFAYDKQPVLTDINLNVAEGDFLAIIGPNGGGKSTLLKLMLGILVPDQGSVQILGARAGSAKVSVGYVPQNTNVNTDFPIRVLDAVMIGNSGARHPLFGYSREEKQCAHAALHQVGMADYAGHRIGALSGGQRQRVMIARALCRNPRLLILDEPTASIDAAGQKEIYDLLKTLNRSMTVIVVSHDLSVILGYATQAAYVHRTLTYHDISDKRHIFHTHGMDTGHFCEVEILEMLGGEACDVCADCDDSSPETEAP